MAPKISIIVPVYNVEAYIHKCIQSILAQTFTDFELILVDDGSPDNCGMICDEYALSDNRVKVIHKENGGLSDARNAGINTALGNYIGFVDSDDYIDSNMYEELYLTAVTNSSDLVVCDFIKVNEGENICKKKFSSVTQAKNFTNLQGLEQLYKAEPDSYMTGAGNNVRWITSWNKLYRKSLFENIKFVKGKIFEDEFITHKILYNCKKISYHPGELYYYVQRPNSIINSAFTLKNFDKVLALKDRADFFKSINQKYLHERAIKSYMDAFFWNYYTAKSELTGIKEELKALKDNFNSCFVSILKNPLIGRKQRAILLLFVINPIFYDLYRKVVS